MARRLYMQQLGLDVAQGFVANWIAVAGAVPAATKDATVACLTALIQAGVWDKLDRFFLLATADAAHALTDLRYAASATAVNSPTFTANRGYTGNGTASYVNTNFNSFSAVGAKFTRDDAAMGAWSVVAPTVNGRVEMGNNDSGYSWISGRNNVNVSAYAVNTATAVGGLANAGVYTGQFHAQRKSALITEFYRNGALLDAQAANASITLLNSTHKILGVSGVDPAAPVKLSDGQVGCAYIGKSLTAAEVAALYNALRAYMTAVGVP